MYVAYFFGVCSNGRWTICQTGWSYPGAYTYKYPNECLMLIPGTGGDE